MLCKHRYTPHNHLSHQSDMRRTKYTAKAPLYRDKTTTRNLQPPPFVSVKLTCERILYRHRNFSGLPPVCRKGARPELPPPDALPEVPPPSRTPFKGPVLPPLGPGGSRIGARVPVPVEKHPDRQHISPGPERLGSSKCRSALTKSEPGRRFVPGGRFTPVMDAGGRNYRPWMPGTKLELPGRKIV
jgi:hypothetical protein